MRSQSLVIHPGQAERKERARSLKRFMLSDMGVYFLSLLMCDLITALGAVANVYWSTQVSRHRERLETCSLKHRSRYDAPVTDDT